MSWRSPERPPWPRSTGRWWSTRMGDLRRSEAPDRPSRRMKDGRSAGEKPPPAPGPPTPSASVHDDGPTTTDDSLPDPVPDRGTEMPYSVATHDIPVVILCGGMGTRLREASEKLPKPLVDIGGRPILWHIMKTYEAHGFRRFVLALGYKSELIKQYFLDYRHLTSDFTLRLDGDHEPVFHDTAADVDWEITFVETGLTTGTAARIRRVAQHLDAPRFALTYGDGIGDVDVTGLLRHHVQSDLLGTLTGVHPGSRYGEMRVQGTTVVEFNEKPTLAEGWVNGGFFLFER